MGHILKCHDIVKTDFVSAEGCFLYDAQGRRYIDFESGIWCTAFGNGHSRIDRAITDLLSKVMHLGTPGNPISADQLTVVPFFNAQQVFASNIQVISFQNGAGVRFLTQYAQYLAPINNHELFYQFQGVTSDGAYYILAILPITAPFLAGNSDIAATMPIGGAAFPDMGSPNPDWDGYYTTATELLNTTSPDSFTPAINQLDLLIQSIEIA